MTDALSERFDRQFRENRERVYRLALALTNNGADAEEITQEAFARAWRSFGDFNGESSFFTWIYRIALNVASDYLRQRAKFPVPALTEDLGYRLEEILDQNPASNPETELLARQARVKCLHSLTECLLANERKVFCLAITLGLPHREVAQILECSVGAVKTTLHRARKRWFGYMEDRCQLIRESNPCSCSQWVRFGLEQGWLSAQAPAPPPPAAVRAREEISELKRLRDLYRETAAPSYVARIREGLNREEWKIFS